MSLLIKALASAEKGKQAELGKGVASADASADLMLEPLPKTEPTDIKQKADTKPLAEAPANKEQAFNAAATASLAKVRQQSDHKKESIQQAAANVFVANQSAQKPVSIVTLITVGVVCALLILLALQLYQYFNQSAAMQNQSSKPTFPPAAALNNAQPSADVSNSQPVMVPVPVAAPSSLTSREIAAPLQSGQLVPNRRETDTSLFAGSADGPISKPQSVDVSAMKRTTGQRVAEDGEVSKEASKASEDMPRGGAPLKLITRTPAAGVDPVLLSAYEAYSRGDDAAAQQQYRQVLQADIRNVDALLGMAAIAARQSRYADANGWYQKVLEIEPRNSFALSAIANLETNSDSARAGGGADYAASESRIKNMLAQQPDAANLHAALGNLYASRNQWGLAQAAYFDASRYAPNSADYAFNLAVSLDQLGKSALALAQYQRALDLLNNSGAGKVDKAQLEARIKALQN